MVIAKIVSVWLAVLGQRADRRRRVSVWVAEGHRGFMLTGLPGAVSNFLHWYCCAFLAP